MDDVLLAVREAREAYARRFSFDLRAIHNDLKAQEKAGGRRVVSLSPRPPRQTAANGAAARKPSVRERTTGSS